MSTENTPESGRTATESGDGNAPETEVEVNRTAEEYAKRVVELSAENKKRKLREQELAKKLADYESKLSSIDEEKLKEQGKYKESYEKTKKELAEERAQRVKEKQSYAFKIVTGQLAQAAAKLGCVDTDSLVELAGAKGLLDELEPDDNFNLAEENVKSVIEQAQQKMPFLFGKPAPKVVDGNPKVVNGSGKKELNQVSLQDKIRMLSEIDQKRFATAVEAGDRRTFKTQPSN